MGLMGRFLSTSVGRSGAFVEATASLQPGEVDAFVRSTFTPYSGDHTFLQGASPKTEQVWARAMELIGEEAAAGGVLDVDVATPSTVVSHPPGFILQEGEEHEAVVGMQTDAPLKRAIKPFGGVRTVQAACESYGYSLDADVEKIFSLYRKTHNAAVFDVYTPEMRAVRKNKILTGLPDAYGRGRIIGDYRRVALFGIDRLIAEKKADHASLGPDMDEPTLRLREEVSEQIRALHDLKTMAAAYGPEYDLSRPAETAREAVQWTWFAFLGALKSQDGAAMSLGRLDAFLDTFIEKDLAEGTLDESGAQELIDQFVIQCRLVRHLRTPEYNELFAGDPAWLTAAIGGIGADGTPLVTKTSFRFLQTLYNLGPHPEPNLTVLWDADLPQSFKDFAAKTSIKTSSVQYESDALMRARYGSDYSIACCVSAMETGKATQQFGARANAPKMLLYAINQGRDEVTGAQVAPAFAPVADDPLDYDEVMDRLDQSMDWLAKLYVNTMNCIHWSHDKYAYEAVQMALHDTHVRRNVAFGLAGMAVLADSLSAIKHASVRAIRDERGLATRFEIDGDFPRFGNDDDAVDTLYTESVSRFMEKLRNVPTYRGAEHQLSLLTITSNVVYGNNTGDTPDGRSKGEPFAPGCNPQHQMDKEGVIASLNSVAKIPYDDARDGISNTCSIIPSTLGKTEASQIANLGAILDGYFEKGAHHINVNVLNRETLLDAMEHPENYPMLTIRVSGYAVRFTSLTPAQQREVVARTFHSGL